MTATNLIWNAYHDLPIYLMATTRKVWHAKLLHEFHETRHSVTLIAMVNSHQR